MTQAHMPLGPERTGSGFWATLRHAIELHFVVSAALPGFLIPIDHSARTRDSPSTATDNNCDGTPEAYSDGYRSRESTRKIGTPGSGSMHYDGHVCAVLPALPTGHKRHIITFLSHKDWGSWAAAIFPPFLSIFIFMHA